MSYHSSDSLPFVNLSTSDDDEFMNKLSNLIDRIRESTNDSIVSSEICPILNRCFIILEMRIRESDSEETFSSCMNIIKYINEIHKRYDVLNVIESGKIENVFKLTSVLNDNDLSTDIGVQIQCLHCLHMMVSSNNPVFVTLFKKFNGIEMIKNFFSSVDMKVQSLVWKLIKRILKKHYSSLIMSMKDVLLEIILDNLDGNTHFKIKIIAAEVFLNILIYNNSEMRNLTNELDSIQILLNQIHFEHQEMIRNQKNLMEKCTLMTKYLWCLLQLVISHEEKQFFRDIGGIPIIIALISYPNYQSDVCNSRNEITNVTEKYFRMIEVASTLISTLSKNENCNLEIVQKSGIYLLAHLLISIPNTMGDVDILQKHLFRALRFLFSLERNRKKFKNMFPVALYEAFVDIGHFCENLNLYNELIVIFNNVSEIDKKNMRESIECLNQKEETKCIRDYAILELLGSGAFGSVYKAKRKKTSAGSYCAIKEVNLSECQIGATSQERRDSIYQIVSELDIIKKQLRHPHVVRYYRTFNDAQNLYVVMAFLEGISLGEQINCMREKREMYGEPRIWKIVLQLLQALRYLHKSKGIIHRDLTPCNIIIGDKDYVTITDFGLAKQRLLESSGRGAQSILGTLTYVCPEVIQHRPFGEKADIWALGCIVYQICTLTQPFVAQSELDLVNKICQLNYVTLDRFISPFTNEKLNYSSKIHNFIEHSIVLDSNYRYDVLGLAALVVEEVLINLDETEYSLSKEMYRKKRLENQINESNANKFSMYDMHFISHGGSSREVSPSVSSMNNQNMEDLNIDCSPMEKSPQTTSPDIKPLDIPNQSNQNILSLSFNRNKIPKDNSNTGQLSELNLKKLYPQTTSTGEVRMRPLSSKSLMSISQKSLRHITEDPITITLTWLHKIYFLSRGDYQSVKIPPYSDKDLVEIKRYFKKVFQSIFKLNPSQMKTELNNMISGRDSSLQLKALSSNNSTRLSNISSEKLHYLMDDLLEKLNY